MIKISVLLCIVVFLLAFSVNVFAMGRTPEPPGQPSTGYGSDENYICDRLLGDKPIDHHNCIDFGDTMAGTRCWVYIPQVLKNGSSAPVVVYLHGFMAIVPPIYNGQIEHLVKQGYIVIFPEYNLGGFTGIFNDVDQYEQLGRAIDAVDEAHAISDVSSRAEMDNIILASHSNGGIMSLGWVAGGGIPVKSMVMTHPNISMDAIPAFVRNLFLSGMVVLDYEIMAREITCPVMMIGGEEDTIAKPSHVESAYNSLTNASTKVYYEFQSDNYGSPDLESDHMAACQDDGIIPAWILNLMGGLMGISAMEEDAIDFRVIYAAVDAALDDQTRIDFEMGRWSDDRPVEPVITIEEN